MGSGSHFETLPGYGSPKPVAGLREAAELMQRLWRGEKVTIDGEVVKFKDGSLDWKPTEIPQLYIASRGPQILRVAGAVADGVLIGSFATPPGIAYAKEHILPGLEASKRSWQDIRLCSWIYLSVLEREDDPVPEGIKRGVSFAFWSSRKALSALVDTARARCVGRSSAPSSATHRTNGRRRSWTSCADFFLAASSTVWRWSAPRRRWWNGSRRWKLPACRRS